MLKSPRGSCEFIIQDIIMPRCACASKVYGSVFVSVYISSASIVIFYLVLELPTWNAIAPFRKVRSKTCPWSAAATPVRIIIFFF